MAEIVAAAGRTEVAVEPGTRFKYSNLAYGLLGEVVARRSGMPYVDYVRANIFEPLGMADSGFERDGAAGRIAAGRRVGRVATAWAVHIARRPTPA